MISLIRIDYRLVHGQVVVGWLNPLGIDRIVVIDDRVGSSDSEKSILSLSKPEGKKMHIFTLKEALERKNKLSQLPEKTALIFSNTDTCLEFLKHFNSNLMEVNYGAIPKKDGSKEYDKAVFLTEKDIENSKELINLGYKVYSQQTPSASKKDLNKIL